MNQLPFYVKFGRPFSATNRVVFHFVFWASYLVYEGIIWGMVDGEYAERSAFAAVELPIKIAATYFTLYVLIDRLLILQKYALFVWWLAISMVCFGVLLRAAGYYTLYPVFYPEGLKLPLLYPPKLLIAIFSIYSVAGIVAAFHVVKHWHTHQQEAQLLEKEKIESELTILKSQINPHFLFNTLNSLYVLTLHQSKNAPDLVHKLSGLMSYMLYDSNQPEVALKKELEYIENYIALERFRYESLLDISVNIYIPVEGVRIAPLLILPFVENCFKHGVTNKSASWIRIDVDARENTLILKVENSKPDEHLLPSKRISGIGLQNVRKRLDLIYPGRYDLQLIDEEDSYLVILELPLDTPFIASAKRVSNEQFAS